MTLDIAARVKAEQERDAAQKALRTVQNAAKTLAHSRDSELQHLRENGAYDHKLRAEHDSLIERDALMTDRITALEAERDALKEALTKIAAYTDDMASDHLAATGSYGRFDECYSVETARRALEAIK